MRKPTPSNSVAPVKSIPCSQFPSNVHGPNGVAGPAPPLVISPVIVIARPTTPVMAFGSISTPLWLRTGVPWLFTLGDCPITSAAVMFCALPPCVKTFASGASCKAAVNRGNDPRVGVQPVSSPRFTGLIS